MQVNYEGRDTNLHALWDSRLLEHEELNDDQLATKVDKATPNQVAQRQKDSLLGWLWESYQLSSVLYKEGEGMFRRTITDEYYNSWRFRCKWFFFTFGGRLAGVKQETFA